MMGSLKSQGNPLGSAQKQGGLSHDLNNLRHWASNPHNLVCVCVCVWSGRQDKRCFRLVVTHLDWVRGLAGPLFDEPDMGQQAQKLLPCFQQ